MNHREKKIPQATVAARSAAVGGGPVGSRVGRRRFEGVEGRSVVR
jgi:hypothetical protein